MSESCENCRFWIQDEGQEPDAHPRTLTGECHRYPPVSHPDDEDGGSGFTWPPTLAPDWCGEWQPKRAGGVPLHEFFARYRGSVPWARGAQTMALKTLHRAGIGTVEDLTRTPAGALLDIPGFGPGALDLTRALLRAAGLFLPGEAPA